MVDLNQHRASFEKGVNAIEKAWLRSDDDDLSVANSYIYDLLSEIEHFLSGYRDEGN